MGSYIPNTPEEQQEMLKAIGASSFDDLYADVPEDVRLKDGLNLPGGKSELEVDREMKALAAKNKIYGSIFRGAGVYWHYIPAIVKEVTANENFVTAYTPYQPEINQGVLQSIFEYQTMICELTGMDVSNASVYDGATAAAEAAHMCVDRKRSKIFISETVDPKIVEVVETYCYGSGTEITMVPAKDGMTDVAALSSALGKDAAGVIFQQPNYFGILEPAADIINAVHEAGAKAIMSVNPTTLGYLETPGELGADIAVGEGQPLGIDMAFGGPYLGFMAATQKLERKLPGRIIGQTEDTEGRRSFVLTLQAREQHIRREKAGSNICSNQALCALAASVYMAAMGPDGMKEAAIQCASKAHYLRDKLAEAGLKQKYDAEFFNEFVTVSDADTDAIMKALDEEDILGGLPLGNGEILWCATEMNTKADIDRAAAAVASVTGKEVTA
ncbi:MAG: aminomethyl-transferring glycine dehydrogenase subunit GcvPA [Anaerovoracaceae bacterium]|nr:aminomethyl-transferring glycine dehydrogenase subunit GcvPA [Anaerovoracaceae bacterium]